MFILEPVDGKFVAYRLWYHYNATERSRLGEFYIDTFGGFHVDSTRDGNTFMFCFKAITDLVNSL